MREIKFRALAVVNDKHNNIKIGDFVYGQYIESGCDAPCIIFGDGEQIEVDKKTLCQFTGLKCMNDVDIYEGDLVEWVNGDTKKIDSGTIEWDETYAGFGITGGHCLDWNHMLNIIGNIHQNPELI